MESRVALGRHHLSTALLRYARSSCSRLACLFYLFFFLLRVVQHPTLIYTLPQQLKTNYVYYFNNRKFQKCGGAGFISGKNLLGVKQTWSKINKSKTASVDCRLRCQEDIDIFVTYWRELLFPILLEASTKTSHRSHRWQPQPLFQSYLRSRILSSSFKVWFWLCLLF